MHAQRTVCTTQLSKSTSSLGELHVVRVLVPLVVVCDEAVVRCTLGLIALAVGFVFLMAIVHRILLMVDILFTHPVGDSELLLAVTEF